MQLWVISLNAPTFYCFLCFICIYHSVHGRTQGTSLFHKSHVRRTHFKIDYRPKSLKNMVHKRFGKDATRKCRRAHTGARRRTIPTRRNWLQNTPAGCLPRFGYVGHVLKSSQMLNFFTHISRRCYFSTCSGSCKQRSLRPFHAYGQRELWARWHKRDSPHVKLGRGKSRIENYVP